MKLPDQPETESNIYEYDNSTKEKALSLINDYDSDMGGTNILTPIEMAF